jgi:hypothetical protein
MMRGATHYCYFFLFLGFVQLLLSGLRKVPQATAAFDPKPNPKAPSCTDFERRMKDLPISASPQTTMSSAPQPLPSKPKPLEDDDTLPSLSDDSSSVESESLGGSFSSDDNGHDIKGDSLPEVSPFLAMRVPDSTRAERIRFLKARDGDEKAALVNLLEYISWRERHENIQRGQEQRLSKHKEGDSDLYDWLVASETAMQANNEESYGKQPLPRVLRMLKTGSQDDAVDLDGKRIIHVLPGQIDDSLCTLPTYALAIALYLDRKANRKDTEKITVLMDLRPGYGWRNLSAITIIPFIKDVVGLVLTIFPERLHKSILYPLPFALSWVFKAVKLVIDPETANKIFVLSGSAGFESPFPLDQMTEHVEKQVALHSEFVRMQEFTA